MKGTLIKKSNNLNEAQKKSENSLALEALRSEVEKKMHEIEIKKNEFELQKTQDKLQQENQQLKIETNKSILEKMRSKIEKKPKEEQLQIEPINPVGKDLLINTQIEPNMAGLLTIQWRIGEGDSFLSSESQLPNRKTREILEELYLGPCVDTEEEEGSVFAFLQEATKLLSTETPDNVTGEPKKFEMNISQGFKA